MGTTEFDYVSSEEKDQQAEILSEHTKARAGNATIRIATSLLDAPGGASVATLRVGTRVQALPADGMWTRVGVISGTYQGRSGWIARSAIRQSK